MALASATAAATTSAVDAVKPMFEKQISTGSTDLPDDFSRNSTVEQEEVQAEVDVFEARGGLAESLSWQLAVPAEKAGLTTAPAIADCTEVDLFEARGGLAAQLRAAAETEADEYEARGGIATRVQCRLPSFRTPPRLPPAMMHDEYEARGSLVAWSASPEATALQQAQADVYEARGGLAELSAWQLPKPTPSSSSTAAGPALVGGEEVDLLEARGGIAEVLRTAASSGADEYEARGGAAAQVHCMLPGARAQLGLPRAAEGDEYEARGGLAAWLPAQREAEVDVYQLRGGAVEQLAWQLPKPEGDAAAAEAALLAGGDEVDLYEVRGGLAAELRAAAALSTDEYEARGGIAAQVACRLPQPVARCHLPAAAEGDELEMRGGLAAWRSAQTDSAAREADVYEARGGLAEQLAPQLPVPAAGASMPSPPVFVNGAEVDLHEARGGMAEQLCLAAGVDADEYEARGGLAAQVQCRLATPSSGCGLRRVPEGDEYEMRGGMAAWLSAQ